MHADTSCAAIPLPRSAPDPLREKFLDDASAGEHLPLLLEAQGAALAAGLAAPAVHTPASLRRRLLERAGRSARQTRGMVNVRRSQIAPELPASGVRVEPLYRAAPDASLRPGEPWASELVLLEPGTRWQPTTTPRRGAVAEEWLVLEGRVAIDGQALEAEDFHRIERGCAGNLLAGSVGARLLRRLAPSPAGLPPARITQHGAARAPWADFGPGIQRRVLHLDADGAAAMLYRTAPGATVPHHGHGHDEECYMVDGEIFLDDLLLRRGEYQLAPAGTEHGSVFTDTGVVLYTHGDVELDLRVA
jgi:quercetin dioxygenase-like cupin family protein